MWRNAKEVWISSKTEMLDRWNWILWLMQVSGIDRSAESGPNRTYKLICFVVNVRSFLTRRRRDSTLGSYFPVWNWNLNSKRRRRTFSARMCMLLCVAFLLCYHVLQKTVALHDLEPILKFVVLVIGILKLFTQTNFFSCFDCLSIYFKIHSGHSCVHTKRLLRQFSTQLYAFYKRK